MSKIINEIGNKYGYLTVIDRGPNNSSGRATWVCKCDCGKIVNVVGSQLRSGKTKSCGCYQKEQTIKACVIDLTGQTISNFYILGLAPSDKSRSKWHCRCLLCGNEDVYISTANLQLQESCGCLHQSKGERKIEEILNKNNIKFIKEKRFNDCVFPDTGHLARFDFYLPDYNCLIEYDGRQHFILGNGVYDNEEKFQKTQLHDNFKTQYAVNNGYTLIRIPYTKYNTLCLNDLLP